jgi:hypothetical protein
MNELINNFLWIMKSEWLSWCALLLFAGATDDVRLRVAQNTIMYAIATPMKEMVEKIKLNSNAYV